MEVPFTIRPNTLATNLRLVTSNRGVPRIVVNTLANNIFKPFYKERVHHGTRPLDNRDRVALRKIFEKFHTTKTRVHDLARRILQARIRESAQYGHINVGHRRQLRFWAWLWIETRRQTAGGRTPSRKARPVDPTALVRRMLFNASGGGWPNISDHNFSIREGVWVRRGGGVARPHAVIPLDLTKTPPSAYTLVAEGRKVHGVFTKRNATNVIASAANLKSHLSRLFNRLGHGIRLSNTQRRDLLSLLETKNLSKSSAHIFANKIIKSKLAAQGNVNANNLKFWIWLEQVTLPENRRVAVSTRFATLTRSR